MKLKSRKVKQWLALSAFIFTLNCFNLEAAAFAQASSLNTQVPKNAGTSIVKLDSIDITSNIDVSPNKDMLIIKQPGVYFMITSGQIGATDPSSTGAMNIWMLKNGKAIPNSGCTMSVDSPGTTGVLVSQTIMPLLAGDKIATGFSATGPGLGFIFTQPENEPAIPSLIFTIFKLDELK